MHIRQNHGHLLEMLEAPMRLRHAPPHGYFQVSQEAFNRPYELAVPAAPLPRHARVVHLGPAKKAA
ncbi:MAG TPA: hypothetical protein VF629_22535 [Hymenobacter sp.]|uniref:hypothetical protein n=1 Tax=Hymenobacter sp. TaxID=1898978 RepID=UPI002ED7B369